MSPQGSASRQPAGRIKRTKDRRRLARSAALLGSQLSLAIALPFACRDFSTPPSKSTTAGSDPGGSSSADGGIGGSSRASVGHGGVDARPPTDPESAGGGAAVRGLGGTTETQMPEGGKAGQVHPLPESPNGGGGGGGEGGRDSTELELPPTAFSQLVLWLEARPEDCDTDDDSHVSVWHDQTSFRNDATAAAGYDKPSFVQEAVNGHAALRFVPLIKGGNELDEPTRLLVQDVESLRFGTEDLVYLVIGQWSNSPVPKPIPNASLYLGAGSFLSKQALGHPYTGVFLSANYPGIFSNVTATTKLGVQLALGGAFATSSLSGLNDGQFRLYEVRRRQSTKVVLRINGADQGSTVVPRDMDFSGVGAPLYIGGIGSEPLNGALAEIVALRGDIPDDELAALEKHLLHKYAIAEEQP